MAHIPRRLLLLLLSSTAAALVAAVPAAALPFAPSSVWNAPLSASAALSASSAPLVSELQRQVTTYGAWINTWQYSTPVYTVAATQPAVRVQLDTSYAALQNDFAAVPLPPDARPALGTDAHLTVYQPSSDTLWEFWKLAKLTDGWHARWGGKMTGVSANPGYFNAPLGATATSLPLLGGLMRISELQSGHIDHALSLAIPVVKAKEFVWPAQRTDGSSTLADAIPAGTRFRLDPNLDVATLGLPPVAYQMALAAQRYGIIVRDGAGAVTFYGEDAYPTATNPYPTLFQGKYPNQVLAKFPWSRLQVVATPTTPVATLTPATATSATAATGRTTATATPSTATTTGARATSSHTARTRRSGSQRRARKARVRGRLSRRATQRTVRRARG